MSNENVRAVFAAAVAEGKSADETKVEMIKAGCDFKDTVKLYKEWALETGLIVDNKKLNEQAADILSAFDAFDTTESLDEAINALVDDMEVEPKKAASLIRSYAKKNGMEVAKRKKAGGGASRSGFVSKFYDALAANPSMTEDDAHAIIHGEGDNEETSNNVKKHESHYQAIRQLCNKIAA